ncbi:N-ras oncogene p21, partial [Mycena vulgaris]
VVGNQCDVIAKRRQVSTEEGKMAAQDLGCEFAETSAKTGEGVEATIQRLVRARREPREGKSRAKKEKRCQIM